MKRSLLPISVLCLALAAASAWAVRALPAPAGTARKPQFENEEVKVWKSVVMPGTPLPPHRHDHPRVLIALVGGKMKIVESDGSSKVHDWETGKAYWLPANPPGVLHSDVNAGDQPIEVMVVELQKAR